MSLATDFGRFAKGFAIENEELMFYTGRAYAAGDPPATTGSRYRHLKQGTLLLLA